MAVLAIPFLVIDSSSTAEGIVESVEGSPFDRALNDALVSESPSIDIAETAIAQSVPERVAVVLEPNVTMLATRALSWNAARREAIEKGVFVPTVVAPPSNTRLELLPDVVIPGAAPPADGDVVEGDAAGETDNISTTTAPPETTTTTTSEPPEPPAPVEDEAPNDDPEPAQTDPPADNPEHDEAEGQDPEPAPTIDDAGQQDQDPVAEPEPAVPTPPAQVGGRVPPPAGGPTAAQWDALRRCESTHNYQAISVSGLYRGAYQFSQQTWDWVAGIHYPYLVGIDPIDAAHGWQDVMAYTLYAMRGWDQWPICGKHLL